MFDILEDILIITESGKVIASKIRNQQIEEQLFGMLISALSSYAQELTNQQLHCVEFSNHRFDIIRKNSFLFLATSSRIIRHKKALNLLHYVADLFFQRYPREKLNNWDGSFNIFHELEEYMSKSKDELIIELIFKKKMSMQ